VSSPLHVVHVIDSLTAAGAESSLAAMAPGLVASGVRLDVIALTARAGVQDLLREAGASVTELDGSRRTWWRQVHTLVRQSRPDLVHTTLFEANISGRIAARRAHTPVVSTLANEMYGAAHHAGYGRHTRMRAAQVIDGLTARLAVRLHSVSTHVADVMARRLRYPRARIDVVPRGRDPEVLGRRTDARRRRARTSLGIGVADPLVLAIARQEHQKGLDVLIDATLRLRQQHPRARCVVAGRPGNVTRSLEEQIRRSGAPVALLGGREDVPDLLCAADLFVLPSRREGLPGALLEAMALECPAVVSDLPQIQEVVDDEIAVLVPPDHADALAVAVESVLANPEAAHARATAARARFLERFTIDAIVEQMLAFYRRALAR
jgi:glycosyltransferase involved in cell wall biosynthesis